MPEEQDVPITADQNENKVDLDREKAHPYEGEVVIIKVGTNLGAGRKKNEVGSAPDALLRAGLVKAIKRDVGASVEEIIEIDVAADPSDPAEIPEGGVLNEQGNIRIASDLAAEVERQRKLGRRVIVLGGDHSVSLGSVPGFVGAIKDQYGADAEGGKFTIDAHGDLQNREKSPSKRPHGMVEAANFGQLQDDDSLAHIHRKDTDLLPENGMTVGVNDLDIAPENDEAELASIAGVRQFTRDAINIRGLGAVVDRINSVREKPQVKELLVSLDIDGLHKHATGMVNKNGVTDSEMTTLSKELSNSKASETPVTVIEIAEYTPGRDKNQRTAKFVCNQIVTLLGGRPQQTVFEKIRSTRLYQEALKMGVVGTVAASAVLGFFGIAGKTTPTKKIVDPIAAKAKADPRSNDRAWAFTGISSKNPFTWVSPSTGWTANTGKMMENGFENVAEAMAE
ncbi:MAG: arginase family protein, partial [Candidatus Peribacteraceae bacterium]|nr:arginase family protein [Candidatus Peribacteraceae bacterium]